MTLKISGIDHINFQVRDLDESCEFWAQLFGFEILEDMPELSGRIVGNSKAKLALYENVDLPEQRNDGFSHVSFHVENFEEVEKLCEGLGLKILYDGTVNWPRSRSIYIRDPNGYEIELAEVWGGGL